ncbi:MAG: VWA domain-containing protein [Flavobacteriales bacterium]|nr:VWA domain-containing protein [Flavobacteriales bacterium]
MSSKVVDYQLIDNSSARFVDLEIKNTSPKKAFIFRLETPETYRVVFSSKTLDQDSIRYIRIKYNPEKTGYFEDKLQLHLSSESEPLIIKTKGFVKEFRPNSNLDCPSFGDKNIVQENSFDLTIEVVDQVTREPIPSTNVKMIYNGFVAQELTTKSNGKIIKEVPLGLYYLVFKADDYEGVEFSSYVNRNNNYILAELIKLVPVEVDTTEEIIVLTPPDTVPEDLPDLVLIDTVLEVDSSDFSVNKFAANNIVFCVDISSSMKYIGKLDLLKASMIELTNMLRPIDNITIVTYASEAQVLLETTPASNKKKILEMIESLEAQGHTAGIEGMKLAYSKACEAFIHGGNNQVIMTTDGGFNKGQGSTKRLAKKFARKKIKMSVVGIKNTYRHEQSMRDVAASGSGHFIPIKNYEDAQIALKQEIMSQSILKKAGL